MTRELLFTNARIIIPEQVIHGTFDIKEGYIAGIDSSLTHLPLRIDLEGDYLLPGFIELHADHLENHVVPRTGFRWPSMAAILSHDAAIVSAIITTVFDALAIIPIMISRRIKTNALSTMNVILNR